MLKFWCSRKDGEITGISKLSNTRRTQKTYILCPRTVLGTKPIYSSLACYEYNTEAGCSLYVKTKLVIWKW